MDRQIVYPGQILPETSLLQMAKDSMIGAAKLASALLGTSTYASGFAVTPTGPASLQVVYAPGEIYSLASIDALAFSTLPADTTHSILKQGVLLDGGTLSCPAPGTTGQSINYLVQVTYQDSDSTPVLLPYYNSANPALPFSGQGNNGLTQNTVRKGVAVVSVKAGASAVTGSQVTPAPDAGYIGLYVVTVAFGQSTITSGNIAQAASAPLINSTLHGLVPAFAVPLTIVPATSAQHAIQAGQIQNMSLTAFTTAGTSPSLTLTPSPAAASYTNLRFSVKFSANSTGADTLNISTLGAKSLKQYDAAGNKVAASFASGQAADVQYDGTDLIVLDPLPSSVGKAGSVKALLASATGTNATVTVTAEELIVESSTNTFQTLRSVSVTPTFANAGVNGLDVGAANSQAAGQWYSVWVIWNGTTVAGLLSLSATAPTMPSGYTHKARVGWVITDLTANKYPLRFDQAGRKVTISPLAGTNVSGNIVMAQGVQGTISGSGLSVSVNSFIPSTAWAIEVFISTQTGSGGTVQVGRTGTLLNSVVLSITNETNQATSCMVGLDGSSRNLVFASTLGAGVLVCRGWEDNL